MLCSGYLIITFIISISGHCTHLEVVVESSGGDSVFFVMLNCMVQIAPALRVEICESSIHLEFFAYMKA